MKDATKRRKKPGFVRQDSNKYKFKAKWRKPRGLHSKLRIQKRGHRKLPGIGYGNPKEARFRNKEGNFEVIVTNLKDIDKLGKDDVVKLSSKLGMKSRIMLVEECKKRGLFVVNLDIEKFIAKVRKIQEDKKKVKKKRDDKKKAREAKAKKDVKKESQEEVKKDVMESKVKSEVKPVKETMLKESKVDTARQRVIPEGKK
tara:strand:- start:7306 stop:7905 length:600 start_codon:yes stop_codon:yes gene_type:complete